MHSPNQRRLAYGAQLVALATAYVASAHLGLSLSPVGGYAALVWPPFGISLAALLIWGYRLWPAVTVGALVTEVGSGRPPLVTLAIVVGSTLEVVVGAYALRRVPGFRPELDRTLDVVALVTLGGVAGATIGATAGVGALSLAGRIPAAAFCDTWRGWWLGDVTSAVLITPLLLTQLKGPKTQRSLGERIEAAAVGAITIGLAALLFTQRPETVTANPILRPFILFLPLTWMAVRFGTRGAATSTFLVACVAIAGTYAGHGAFVRDEPAASLAGLHVFLATIALTMLALGSVVAERERSRQSLHASEALLAAVIGGTTDPVHVKDRNGRYLIVNEAGARLLGRPASDLVGHDNFALGFPNAASQKTVELEVMETNSARETEETVVVDGRTRSMLCSWTPYRDRAGHVLGIIKVGHDITDRKRMEDELRDSEERQRLALESAQLGMWCWDVKSDSIEWTRHVYAIHGFDPDTPMTLHRLLEAVHPDDRAATTRLVAQSIENHTDYCCEHRVVWRDGTVRNISAHGRPYYDATGSPSRMLGVSMDVTAQKEIERERAELLEREQLARSEAESATRAKDDFLAVLSHELRTPLQAMLGWIQLLRLRKHDTATLEKGLSTIERNVKSQAQLIEDLLDISRIVSGKLRLDRKGVDLAWVVESAVESAKAGAEAKSIGIDSQLASVDEEMFGDPDRLQQVVANLLSNAVKFTPEGGTIRVRLQHSNGIATISVKDSGCGIPEAFLPHVFDRFQQAEPQLVHSHRGLGLGLAIVRHIVELHGGTVAAESAGPGRGATFTVALPLTKTHGMPSAPNGGRLPRGAASPPTTLAGVRVLVVDDDPDTCELHETVLRASGADVLSVGTVKAAMAAFSSFNPHLLMSDLGMPGENGFDLIRRVRAQEAAGGLHVPALAVTALASAADREHALALGFEAHVTKPASAVDLLKTLTLLLEGAAG